MRNLVRVVTLLATVSFCMAQDHPAIDSAALGIRPRIGLVLEEHHISVSYVAGTSMGGLVGGMYATGKTPTEMHELVNHIHWGEVLRGETPFQDLEYRRKEDKRDYPNSLEFGL